MKQIEQPKGKFPSRLGNLEYCMNSPTEVRIRTSRPDDTNPTTGQFVLIRKHKYYFSVTLTLTNNLWIDNRSLFVSSQSLSEPDPTQSTKEIILTHTINAWTAHINKKPFLQTMAGRYARYYQLQTLFSARNAKEEQIATLQNEIRTINEQIDAAI